MPELERILFIGTFTPGESGDGNPSFSHAANNFQAKLIEGLQSSGVEVVTVLSIYPSPRFPLGPMQYTGNELGDAGGDSWVRCVPYLNLPLIKPFSQFFSLIRGVLKLRGLKSRRPQAGIAYNATHRWGIPALVAAWLYKAPSICVAADVQPIEPGQSWLHILLHKGRAFWLRRFTGVVVLSGLVAKEFLSPKQSWLHVEGGISPSEYQYAEDVQPLTELYYAGTLSEGSGMKLMLAALDMLPEAYHLTITGNGPLADVVRQKAESDPRLTYLGVLPRKQQLELLQRAGLLLNPRLVSLPENRYNFPSKLLEYLASGRPVISTLTADLSEEYSDLVYVCEQEDPRVLASTITEISNLDPEEIKRRSASAYRKVIDQKNWQAQARRLYEFMQSEVYGSR